MPTVSSKIVAAIRKRSLRRANKLEKVIREMWRDEALLSAHADADPAAMSLCADLGCVCVDHLHPAVKALRASAEPERGPEPRSGDDMAPCAGTLAQC